MKQHEIVMTQRKLDLGALAVAKSQGRKEVLMNDFSRFREELEVKLRAIKDKSVSKEIDYVQFSYLPMYTNPVRKYLTSKKRFKRNKTDNVQYKYKDYNDYADQIMAKVRAKQKELDLLPDRKIIDSRNREDYVRKWNSNNKERLKMYRRYHMKYVRAKTREEQEKWLLKRDEYKL